MLDTKGFAPDLTNNSTCYKPYNTYDIHRIIKPNTRTA